MESPTQSTQSPELSVILITSDRYASICKTVSYLQQQTIQNRIELIIVAPSRGELSLEADELSGFRRYQIVEIGRIQSIGWAYAAGIRAAQAPIVALAEDHCFPVPTWAEALVQAHQQPYAAVGPALSNANPHNAISWADMLIAYVQWMDPAIGQTVNFLPGHNSSYKRDILMRYGDRLEAMLESETLMHWDLRSQGYELYLEPAAKAAHTNFAQLFPWLPVQFRAGRVFAGGRAEVEHWPWFKRLAYMAASPLIPLVRGARILQALNQGERRQVKLAFGTLPMTLLGLTADGLGQMVGYGFGYGAALQDYAEAEFHRELYQ
ncbi:MAG: glycosyltransferase [Leptolyngbya sp. SIO4C1]|nr:glycosyltransferase [Leptolyngbya sp. SIO4C1]